MPSISGAAALGVTPPPFAARSATLSPASVTRAALSQNTAAAAFRTQVDLTPPATTPQPSPVVVGDVNGDGSLSFADGKALLSYLFLNGEEPAGLANADLNHDGEVNIADAVSIFQLLAKPKEDGGSSEPSPRLVPRNLVAQRYSRI